MILNNVFPNINRSDGMSSLLKRAINEACDELNIQCTEYFEQKLFEFHEMLHTRCGIVVIGDSFSGKTTSYRVLAKALSKLHERNEMDERSATYTVINPKSITIGQLYGEFDAVSHEWHDGILAINFRRIAHIDESDDRRKWLVFDGPIDSEWLENMNSVLDENQKLCLMSGDTTLMNESMHLLFEALNLQAASPSIVRARCTAISLMSFFLFIFRFFNIRTMSYILLSAFSLFCFCQVSRCGVIYMSSSSLGWQPLLNSWKMKLPPLIEDVNKQEITSLFMRFCPILLYFVRSCNATV